MTLKQDRFIDEYIKTGNASEAARRVYNTKNPNVVGPANVAKLGDRIQSRLEELENERIASTTEVLERLTSILRGEETEVILTHSGKKITTPARISDRLQAANHLLRVAGAFRDRFDVKVDTGEVFLQTLLKLDAE